MTTESEPADLPSAENGSTSKQPGRMPDLNLDPGLAEGWSRLALFVGLGGLAVGTLLDTTPVFLGSVTLVGLAFVLNSAGKLRHYHQLRIPMNAKLKLSVSWVLLSATVLALLWTYTNARYLGGEGGFFWALAAAGLGFGLLHMAAQSRYLPADIDEQKDG
ncbi:MAG: hypothetical protein ABEH59_02875 [Halobacteriales archaeon]